LIRDVKIVLSIPKSQQSFLRQVVGFREEGFAHHQGFNYWTPEFRHSPFASPSGKIF